MVISILLTATYSAKHCREWRHILRNISEYSTLRFVTQLEKRCTLLSDNFLSTTVFINATQAENFENRVRIKTKNLLILEFLAIVSWYKDEWIGWMIREELKEIIDSDPEKYFVLNFYLKDRTTTIEYLYETSRFHTDEFFGILNSNSLLETLKLKVRFRFKPTSKPKKVQFCRHYKDKGSLKLPHENRNIGPQVRLQNRIEEERKANLDTLAFLQGFLE